MFPWFLYCHEQIMIDRDCLIAITDSVLAFDARISLY